MWCAIIGAAEICSQSSCVTTFVQGGPLEHEVGMGESNRSSRSSASASGNVLMAVVEKCCIRLRLKEGDIRNESLCGAC